MSLTSSTAAPASRATRMLAMSLPCRLISAGEPAPSITSTSFSAISACRASRAMGHISSLRLRHAMRESSAWRWPSRITWLRSSRSGLSRIGFIRTSGTRPAAIAWKYWALPISPPATTRALLLMFCDL